MLAEATRGGLLDVDLADLLDEAGVGPSLTMGVLAGVADQSSWIYLIQQRPYMFGLKRNYSRFFCKSSPQAGLRLTSVACF